MDYSPILHGGPRKRLFFGNTVYFKMVARIGPKWSTTRIYVLIWPILDTIKSTVAAMQGSEKKIYDIDGSLDLPR